ERLLQAARLALAAHDPELAVRLVEAPDTDLSAVDRAEVLVEAHAMRGAVPEVEAAVASVWEGDLDDPCRAHLAKRLAHVRFYTARDLAGALAAYADARRRLADPDAVAAVDAGRASLLAGAGRPAEALRITEAMPPPASLRTRVESAGALATSLLTLGRYQE